MKQDSSIRDSKGRWLPGKSPNPKGRPASASKVRAYIEPSCEALIDKAISLALDGDVAALRICLDRVVPSLKPELPPVKVPGFLEATTITGKCKVIAEAVGQGIVGVDSGKSMLDMLVTLTKLYEMENIEKRLEALEAIIEKN